MLKAGNKYCMGQPIKAIEVVKLIIVTVTLSYRHYNNYSSYQIWKSGIDYDIVIILTAAMYAR